MNPFKMQKYDRHSVLRIEEVLPILKRELEHPCGEKRILIGGVPIKVNGSLRVQTFAQKGLKCAGCGLEGAFFAIERNMATAAANGSYHINLWGLRGNTEVLFTHDHIIDRADGGADNIKNTQTMCVICNGEKAELHAQRRRSTS